MTGLRGLLILREVRSVNTKPQGVVPAPKKLFQALREMGKNGLKARLRPDGYYPATQPTASLAGQQ